MRFRDVSLAVLLVTNAATANAATPVLGPCNSADHRAFDFWVGDWQVFRADTGAVVAESRIESLYGGCGIRENWLPNGGTGGGSLNAWDPRSRLWRQSWVDSTGAWVEFTGGRVDKSMILSGQWRDYGGPGKDVMIRMTYTPRDDGTVVQLGEQSADFGKSWSIAFGYIYKPREGRAK